MAHPVLPNRSTSPSFVCFPQTVPVEWSKHGRTMDCHRWPRDHPRCRSALMNVGNIRRTWIAWDDAPTDTALPRSSDARVRFESINRYFVKRIRRSAPPDMWTELPSNNFVRGIYLFIISNDVRSANRQTNTDVETNVKSTRRTTTNTFMMTTELHRKSFQCSSKYDSAVFTDTIQCSDDNSELLLSCLSISTVQTKLTVVLSPTESLLL